MLHPDLEALFNTLLQETQELMSKHGGFNPWGATLSTTNQIQWIGASNGEEFPEAQELIDLLVETFQRQCPRGVLRAVGICYDVRVVPPGQSEKFEAVCCSLEHASGEAVDVFVPYKKIDEGIHYAAAFSWPREVQFFLASRTQ